VVLVTELLQLFKVLSAEEAILFWFTVFATLFFILRPLLL
jgi:hypothetical protein